MRVFVTGATGFVGSAVVDELIGAGHRVLGLARSDAGAKALAAAGATVHRGDLSDLENLAAGARECDGVIHTAFNHDFSKFAANCEEERCAIEALGAALKGSSRPLLVTAGLAIATPDQIATEEDEPPPTRAAYPRVAEKTAAALQARGVNTLTVRLPRSVHGDGDHGFVPLLISTAREKGISAYVSDGPNRWPAVHRLDAARLYRLALEKGYPGARYHAVADEGVPVRKIAEVIGRRLNVPVVGLSREEAMSHFGFIGAFIAMDNRASSMRTQEALGWHPTQPNLLTDLDDERYFGAKS